MGLRWNAGREGTPVLTVITPQEPTPAATTTGGSLIDEIVRDGARRMLAAALEAEVAAYIAGHADELNAEGRRLVVRNGHAQPRRVLTSSGVIEVHAPRVNDKRIDEVTGQRRRFASAILPAWCRKSPKITEVLALLYLHGLSSQDFVPALEGFLGTGAGLCAPTITRLTAQWQDEAATFGNQGSVHGGLCVRVGRRDPRQHPPRRGEALPARHGRGAGRWRQGTDRAKRGLPGVDRVVGRPAARRRPARYARPDPGRRRRRVGVLVRAARGLSDYPHAALLVPQDRQRFVGAAESAHPGAKRALAEICNAEDREHARRAVAAFKLAYGAKFGKAVAKITDDLDELLAFYDFPAEHWVHLRTTNPIESTFATVRHRTKLTRGPGSKTAGLAMAFKLIQAAQAHWRAVNAPHLVALVRAGARFERGQLVERHAPDQVAAAA